MPEVISLIPNSPVYYTRTDLSVGAPSQVPHPPHLGEGKESTKHRSREDEKTEIIEVTLGGTRSCKNIFGAHRGAGKKPL